MWLANVTYILCISDTWGRGLHGPGPGHDDWEMTFPRGRAGKWKTIFSTGRAGNWEGIFPTGRQMKVDISNGPGRVGKKEMNSGRAGPGPKKSARADLYSVYIYI